MTPQARVATALSVLLLVAGCGGGSSKKSDTAPTAAAAESAAAAINLKATDVPTGFEGAKHEDDTEGDAEEKDFLACVGATSTDADQVKDLFSDDFSKSSSQVEQQEVSSEVTVLTTTAKASGDVKAFQSDKAKGCVETFFNKVVTDEIGSQEGVTVGKPTVTALSPSSDGLDGAFGFRVSLEIDAGVVKLPMELVIQGASKKHTQVSLNAFSLGKVIEQSEIDKLWSTLVDRTKSSAV
jgi:hypothetical protein